MKTFITLTLLYLTIANQGILSTVGDQIHPFQQVIVALSEVASKDFNFQQLFVALDELAESFKARKNEENAFYEQEYQQYQADVQYYQNQITDFKNKIAQLEVDVKDLIDERARLQQFLTDAKQDLYDATKLFNAKEAQINSDKSTFTRQFNEYADTIAVLDQAIALLNEVKDETSLLQKSENIKEISSKMHTHLKQLSSKRVFYQPLVKALSQIAQNNYVDQENLNKVINYMNQLRQSLIDGQTSLQNQFDAQSKLQQDILSEIQAKITGIRDILIPLLQSEIETKDGEIKALNAILNDARLNLAEAEDNLTVTQNRWIERTASHNSLIQQYDNELLAIKDAENALKKGGIFRQ
ncbi:unnamed protein product [Paramecium primaurelia]|uniref:Uncharacterized protein n=1 Tax=Paramecium primaurelia TaxID=5886 RepID=A0A8S1KWW2_PARPR|nr:unnamed protein product [Paramecium primaurelia]